MSPFAALSRRRFAQLLTGASLSVPAVAWATPPRPRPVVTILGDSIAAGFGLPASQGLANQLQLALERLGRPATVRAAGVSGDTTAGGLARLDFSVQADTAVCVVELGANDFLQSVPIAATERNLRAIVRRLKARRIGVVLAAGRVPFRSAGGYVRDFEAMFRRIARSEGVALSADLLAGLFADKAMLQADGLHPSPAGARLLASRLAPSVVRVLEQTRL